MAYYKRRLPHWHPEEAWLFVTWRLAGSLPATRRPEVDSPAVSAGKAFVALDRMLDRAVIGPVWLRDTRVASMVCELIQQAESPRQLCRLGGYVVIGNHVTSIFSPFRSGRSEADSLVQGRISFGHRILTRTGKPFWQHESFDHQVRTAREYERILALHRTESRPGRTCRQP